MGMNVNSANFQCWSANDIEQMSMKLMKNTGMAKHIFPGLQSLLPFPDMQFISRLRPVDDASAAVKKQAYKDMRDHLKANAHRLFPAWQTSNKCIIHPDGDCRVAFRASPLVPECLQPRSLNFSSPTCTPWSSSGALPGEADPTMESFYIYMSSLPNPTPI
eukprot:1235378-Pyramimonas_sp.AAC.1